MEFKLILYLSIFLILIILFLILSRKSQNRDNKQTNQILYYNNTMQPPLPMSSSYDSIPAQHHDINLKMNGPIGICAFDVDGCCLEGQYNTCYYNGKKYDASNGGCTAAAIQACKDKGYIIAVNTASGRIRDKHYKSIGMVDENGNCIVDECNWWNNQKYFQLCKDNNHNPGPNHGGCGKPYIMKHLCDIHGITDRSKAILWDDFYKNIIGAQSAGFGVIPMSNVFDNNNRYSLGPGITQQQIDLFIDGKTYFTDQELSINSNEHIKCNL